MNCFPCFKNKDADGSVSKKEAGGTEAQAPDPSMQTFNFRELAMATKNFRQECLLGEGGFGRVFKGTLQSGEVVAVKQLDRNGMQENREFTVEVTKLSCLQHPNLVKLIGYCADGDQRVLVYEYMSMGSLESHLFGGGTDKEPLDWSTRMKIASGAGQGLEYLHEKAKPAVVYGDVKPSNVLLDDAFEPKLSDVGLSTLGAGDGTNQPSSRMVDTFGYSAPEFSSGGEVTIKSDVYCFGVVLLELITGRRAIDTTRPTDEQNLVTWAQPFFRNPKRFPELADPRLNKQFPITALNQVVGIAGMCLQDEPMVRPLISDVTSILSCISMIPNDPPQAAAPPEQQMEYKNEVQQNGATSEDKSSTDSHSSSSSESEDEEEGGSAENTQSSQISVGESESGSDSDSDDQSDDESTCRSDEGSQKKLSNRKSKKGSSSPSKRKKGSSRPTVVTFKEPNLSSRHNADAKEESSSSSSEESSSESDDNEEKQSSSSRTKRAKQRGASESAIQVENGGHFDRNTTEPAELRNLDTR